MSYELIVGRKTPGDLLNLTNSVTTASWITQRTGNPGKLTSPICARRNPKSKRATLYGFPQMENCSFMDGYSAAGRTVGGLWMWSAMTGCAT